VTPKKVLVLGNKPKEELERHKVRVKKSLLKLQAQLNLK